MLRFRDGSPTSSRIWPRTSQQGSLFLVIDTHNNDQPLEVLDPPNVALGTRRLQEEEIYVRWTKFEDLLFLTYTVVQSFDFKPIVWLPPHVQTYNPMSTKSAISGCGRGRSRIAAATIQPTIWEKCVDRESRQRKQWLSWRRNWR